MTAAKPTQIATRESELPEGWEPTSVGDLLVVKYGKGLKESNRASGKIAVYGSNGVVGHHRVALTKGPTIILGRKGSIGAVHFSRLPCWPIDTTYFIDDFRGLEPEFLVHALRILGLSELDTSTAIPGLNRHDLYSQVISVPPLAEQKRIVEKVEQLLARVNAARDRLARVPAILKRFHQAILAAACSGRLTAGWREHTSVEDIEVTLKRVRVAPSKTGRHPTDNIIPGVCILSVGDPGTDAPRGWRWTPLTEVAKLESGHTPSRKHPEYWGGEIPWIGILDAGAHHGGLISRTNQTITQAGLDNSAARLLPPRTVCLSRTASVGYVVVMGRWMATSQDFVNWVCSEALVPEFLMYALMAEREEIKRFGRGTTHTTIYFPEVKALHICLPPVNEQREIVRRIEALFKLADAIEKRVAAGTARAHKLTQAILAKAFRGELVPTEAELARREGSPYEPASVLLAPIRAVR